VTNLPHRPNFTVNPAAPANPPPNTMEYEDTYAERKRLPDGREIEIVHKNLLQDSESRVANSSLRQLYTAACGCTVGSVFELVECQSDREIVCTRHAFTCQQCGLVYCLACSKVKGNGRICRKCAKKEKQAKFWKQVVGLIWKSSDEST
jgi:hypothetical protein